MYVFPLRTFSLSLGGWDFGHSPAVVLQVTGGGNTPSSMSAARSMTISAAFMASPLPVVRPDGTGEAGKVQSIFITRNRLLKVLTEAGRLFTTETQPLCLSDGTTRAAGELKAGDKILRWQDGKRQIVRVRAVTPTGRVEKVFNLILGDRKVFIAGGFLARSKPPAIE
jgi:hypothetical protein